jgi:PadR family transcriptional regulator, regulatory protein PadR
VAEGSLEMLRGTLDVLILKTLSWGPAHGYAIAEWIEHLSGSALMVEEGSLYPALHRLERRGLLDAEWGLSDANRRAKYYRLTDEGRRSLVERGAAWQRFAEAVGRVLHSAERPAWAETMP